MDHEALGTPSTGVGPAETHPYRHAGGADVRFESQPWYFRKRAVRAVLVVEILCALTLLAGTTWAPQVLFVVLAVTGLYGVGAAVAMVALLRRMSQRQPTKDEALVAWLMLGPCLVATGGLLTFTLLS